MLHNLLTYTTAILDHATEILFLFSIFHYSAPKYNKKCKKLPINKLGLIV